MDNNNLQAGLANINAKADIKAEAKIADNINNHTQIGGTTNNNDYSSVQIFNKIDVIQNYNFQANIQQAINTANENQLKTAEAIKVVAQKENITPEQLMKKISNPENCVAMLEANRLACLIDNEMNRQTLAGLICRKITSNDDFESLIYSKAIKVMEYLTENQLKILSLLNLVQSDFMNEIKVANWQEFREIYNQYFLPLTDIDSKHLKLEYDNLFANGCLSTSLMNFFPRRQFFTPIIRNFISEIIPKEKVEEIKLEDYSLYSVGLWKYEKETDFRFIEDEFDETVYSKLKKYKISDENKAKIIELYIEYGYDSDSLILRKIENFDKYINLFKTIQDTRFSFTPVGLVIASEYLKSKIGITLNQFVES